jgi:hypothetical protein
MHKTAIGQPAFGDLGIHPAIEIMAWSRID